MNKPEDIDADLGGSAELIAECDLGLQTREDLPTALYQELRRMAR